MESVSKQELIERAAQFLGIEKWDVKAIALDGEIISITWHSFAVHLHWSQLFPEPVEPQTIEEHLTRATKPYGWYRLACLIDKEQDLEAELNQFCPVCAP